MIVRVRSSCNNLYTGCYCTATDLSIVLTSNTSDIIFTHNVGIGQSEIFDDNALADSTKETYIILLGLIEVDAADGLAVTVKCAAECFEY